MQPLGESSDSANPYAAPPLASLEPPEVAWEDLEAQPVRPFQTIWLHPRQTVRRLIAFNPKHHVLLLVSLAGIGDTLDRASARNLGDAFPLAGVLLIACLMGPLAGLWGLWVGSHLIRLVGSWIGGTAPRQHVRTAMAWALVPAVFGLPLWIPYLVLLGPEVFTYETPRLDSQPLLWVPSLGLAVIQVVLGIWSLVLLCNTIAEVQGFRSAWLGLANVVLAGVLFMAVMIAVIFTVMMLAGR